MFFTHSKRVAFLILNFKKSTTGSIKCTECSKGYFTNNTGSEVCLFCDRGTYNDIEGSINCTNCSMGFYQNMTGQSKCLECEKGRFCKLIKFKHFFRL